MKTAALWTIVGVIIGGLITLLVSWFYYVKASQDLTRASKDLLQVNESLKEETTRIIRMNEIGLGILEEKGYVKLNRDAQGKIVGRVIELKANIHGTSSTSDVEIQLKRGE
ncbi:MAG: hypothetical protein WAN11_09900 [Syntrophobacteraceae bacterium]